MPAIKNMIGEDVPMGEVLKVGCLTQEDVALVLDATAKVTVSRGKLQKLQDQLENSLAALTWLMWKTGLPVFEFLPECRDEVDNLTLIMDHTIGARPTWRFRVFEREEEEDAPTDDSSGGDEGSS